MSHDPTARRILPQNPQTAQQAQMSSFSFAPQQYQQRETQKSAHPAPPAPTFADARRRTNPLTVDYVFVDEHNRHKRLKGELTTGLAASKIPSRSN
jgi:endonuclease/exonuclease/phosphatase family metal-dependent hydrolase